MPNSNLEQKRLEMLRRQLHGKARDVTLNSHPVVDTGSVDSRFRGNDNNTSYLRGDLLKILSLAGSAIILEFVLKLVFQHRL